VSAPEEKLLLLDTASLYFRAFFGVPESVTAPDGTPVNAIRGLVDFIAHLVATRRPTHLVAAMDEDWRPAYRVAAVPSYKTHRLTGASDEDAPAGLAVQVPVIWEVLDAVGIARVGAPGYEADDVIGTLATTATMPVDVVTGDRDLFQLVDDARGVRILYTARGVGRADVVDEAWVARKYGIPGRSYATFALLRGDPSDGLPGVKGVGEKTAATIVSRYPDEKALMAALDSGDPDLPARGKLEASRDYLLVAPKVVEVARDLELAPIDATLPREPKHPERLVELADRWGIDSPLNRLLVALSER
jgi:5'-3' exonuclease